MKRWLACALLLLTLCVACGLPIPGGVTAVRKISGPQPADETDPVKRIPPAPFPGESPEAILRGFLAAGNEPDVAREYLTAANPWIPSESTTVFTGDPVVKTTPLAAGGLAATASITPILFINGDGSTQVPKTTPLAFTLKQENREWRIATPPNGTELEQSDFASSFRRGSLGWLTPDHRSLVRQSVLVPDPESLIPNLVSALIGGPSNVLTSAGVTSVVPGHWTADPPNLDGSQLMVGLHTNGQAVAAADLPALRAQFAATLLSSEITSIVLTLNGQPMLGGSVSGSPVTLADEANFDRDIIDPAGIATTRYLATAGGIVPLVLPGPFITAPTATPSSSGSAAPRGTPGSPSRTTPTPTRATSSGTARATPSTSRATPSVAASPTPLSVFTPGVPITAFAVSSEGQRFAELRTVGPHLQQPVQVNLGSNTAVPLGPPRDYLSLAWGPDDTLWLTTRPGTVYLALRDHAPQQVATSLPLNDLVIAPDGVDAVGVSATGTLVTGLVSDASGGSVSGLTNVAPSLKNVTAVAVVGSGLQGLNLLVAATQSANPLVPGSAGLPVAGLWRVFTGAPDPTDATAEALSESVSPVTSSPCVGKQISGLVARPGTVEFAECSDFSLEAFDQRPGPLNQQWLRVGTGLAGYPLG